jgi:hypothetical protein
MRERFAQKLAARVAPADVEHRRGVHEAGVAAVGAEKRAHPTVVTGAVLDDDLCLRQVRRVLRVGREEVGVGAGIRDQRGDLGVVSSDLGRDVAPEVLCRHDPDRRGPRTRRGGRSHDDEGQADGESQKGGAGPAAKDVHRSHNHNGNHFG